MSKYSNSYVWLFIRKFSYKNSLNLDADLFNTDLSSVYTEICNGNCRKKKHIINATLWNFKETFWHMNALWTYSICSEYNIKTFQHSGIMQNALLTDNHSIVF